MPAPGCAGGTGRRPAAGRSGLNPAGPRPHRRARCAAGRRGVRPRSPCCGRWRSSPGCFHVPDGCRRYARLPAPWRDHWRSWPGCSPCPDGPRRDVRLPARAHGCWRSCRDCSPRPGVSRRVGRRGPPFPGYWQSCRGCCCGCRHAASRRSDSAMKLSFLLSQCCCRRLPAAIHGRREANAATRRRMRQRSPCRWKMRRRTNRER